MSVAAYTSLVSLMQVLDQILKHHGRGRIHLDKQQIQKFQDNVQELQDFLEFHPQRKIKDIRGLARRITNASIDAEILIDYYVVDQMRGVFDNEIDKGLSAFRVALQEVVQEMERIKEELLKMVNLDSLTIHHHRHVDHVPAATSEVKSSSPNTSMVGAEPHINWIIDKLTNHEQSLQVIPIVGMGGIGKTTLAKCVYEDPRIMNRFDRRIWCTISQQYSIQKLLKGILKDLLKQEFDQESRELGEKLHKSLFGLRYLIIMDDMWSVEAWDRLKVFLPLNRNGSRVLVTTRLSCLCLSSSLGWNEPYKMEFLDDHKSLDLFYHKAFDQRDCPAELKEIGKRISKGCRGLPISIVTIAGLLSKSDMSPVYWESVAQNVIQIVSMGDDDEHCSKILWLSYNNLPMHLKPCFLDFRLYPEDDRIDATKIKRSWIAKGLIKSVLGRRIEDVAGEYFKNLLDRNLILIHSRNLYGKIISCGVHDLLRELCLRESKVEEDFIQIPRILDCFRGLGKCNFCRTCFRDLSHGKNDLDVQIIFLDPDSSPSSSSRSHISVCHECLLKYPCIHRLRFIKFPDTDSLGGVVLPTTLRSIRYCGYRKLSVSLHLIPFLWNLQFLVVFGDAVEEVSWIWEMPQLRYVVVPSVHLPSPPIEVASLIVLEELQTLSVGSMSFTKELIERIPNLERLKIYYDEDASGMEDQHFLDNIAFLHRLESLAVSRMNCKTYPNSLKELKLERCNLSYDGMRVIGSMSNLQVLGLSECNFEGNEWIPIQGEFLQLKVLEILGSDLSHWEVEEDHYFPNLERLSLSVMDGLNSIPCGIAEISTLISIELYHCNKSLEKSARLILEQQQKLGNESLHIHIIQDDMTSLFTDGRCIII